MPLQHHCIDISSCVSLYKSPRDAGAGPNGRGISHDYERHSNVAVFLPLTEIVESRPRIELRHFIARHFEV